MGPIGCPETSVRNYHYSLRNDPEEHSSQCGLTSDDMLPLTVRLHETRNWKAATTSCWLSPGNNDGILGRKLRAITGASNLTTVSEKQETACVIIWTSLFYLARVV